MLRSKRMEIPLHKLKADVLDQIIEDFVLREGTDYGNQEYSLEEKKQHILKQLKANKIFISFDSETESINLQVRD